MKREIKFRAWDKTMKQMNYKVLVGNTDTEDPNYTCNSILIGDKWMNADHNCIELMQFTGLHDKNGTAIFEGDVVVIFGNIAVVQFSDFWAGWIFWCEQEEFKDLPFSNGQELNSLHCEVLGNIHENKNLLSNGQ